MKKVFLLILSLVLVLSGCSYSRTGNDSAHTKTQRGDYVKSVWVAYYELQEFIKDDESDFENEIEKRFSQLKDMGFNTITVQVRFINRHISRQANTALASRASICLMTR